MAEPSYALRDVAPLIDCPDCAAASGEVCRDTPGEEPVAAHEGRRQAARALILRLAEEVD